MFLRELKLSQLLVVLASYFQTSLWPDLPMTQSPRKTLFQFTVPLPTTNTHRNEALTQQMLWPSYILHSTAAGRWKVQKFGGTNKIHILYFCFCSLIWISKKIGEARSTNTPSSAGPTAVLSRSQTVFFWRFFIVPIFGFLYWYVEKFKRMCVLLVDWQKLWR